MLTAGLTLPLMRCREAALHRRVILADKRTDLQWVRCGSAVPGVDKCQTKNKKSKNKEKNCLGSRRASFPRLRREQRTQLNKYVNATQCRVINPTSHSRYLTLPSDSHSPITGPEPVASHCSQPIKSKLFLLQFLLLDVDTNFVGVTLA